MPTTVSAWRARAHPREEAGQRLAVAVRRVLDHEVPRAFEHDELRTRDLTLEAPRSRHGRREVVLAPEQQRRHLERGEPPLVGLELLEVARAVELELSPAARLVGERLEVLVDRVRPDPA